MTQPYGPPAPRPGTPAPHTDVICATVPQMHALLAGENPAAIHPHGDAWHQIMASLADLGQELRGLQTALTDRWQGQAADLYLTKLDALARALSVAADASASTHRAVSTMADALHQAQTALAPLQRRWTELDQAEANYTNESSIVKLLDRTFSDGAPDTTPERARLNTQARQVIASVDGAVFDSANAMIPMDQFKIDIYVEKGKLPGDLPGSGSDVGASTIGGSTPQALGSIRLPVTDVGDSPVLDGGTPTPTPPVQLPTTPVPIGPSTGPVPGAPQVPSVIGMPPLIGEVPGRTPAAWPERSTAALGPGGVIGEAPRAGVPADRGMPLAAPMAGAASGARRVNPAGGLIGGAPVSGAAGRTGGRGSRGSGENSDDPFEVDSSRAAPPVLLPGPEPDFTHPGPLIGFDR
jgi:uncharacterized protein YukE